MKKVLMILAILAVYRPAHAWVNAQAVIIPPEVLTSSVSNAAGQAQVTVSTPTGIGPYSSGYYNYVTNIHIEMYATGTLTGGATPVTCTTSGLGGLAFKFPTAAATGTNTVLDTHWVNPIQGTQSSNVVITCPATASVIWNVIIGTFQSN